ncbi:unnamed protein product [Peronospora belbahrii]|uniref:Uncharacterized protein n=1 Tax=Peronospora belbahrii TaxID=622444 RepID=A0AAU9KRP0_9STRA|nr:unnamed protein product [Peronospora belbahrii]CAH0519934.1 unnamed protein product [Peronospora belbahrii]
MNAPHKSPQVISNSSMTMRFSLPPSFLQTRMALSTACVRKELKRVQNDTEDTWEAYDWDTDVDLLSSISTIEIKQQEQVDDWELEPSLDLPDDFPRLLVNLTRLRREHFPTTKEGEEEAAASDFDMMEVFYRVKYTLYQHFSQLVEVLFEQKLCFHCTYGTSRAMIKGLHAAYPKDVFAMVDYPTEIDNVPLHEYLHTLSYPSRWKSVEYLKGCLRRCSRDIRWKKDVITELELLAKQEFAQYEEKQRELSDEIDELSRLRDSFREKLEKMASQQGKPKGQYLMLRKLEDIENRIMTLLDTFLTEPELEEEECYSAFGNPGGEGGLTTSMNVLDMVIAMVFDRLPRNFSQQTTTEEHYQMLFDHHIYILRLWKKDFGRLPQKSRMTSQKVCISDAGSLRVSSDEDRAAYEVCGEHDMVEYVEDCSVHDDGSRGCDEVVHIGVNNHEGRMQDNIDRRCDEPLDRKIHHDIDSDGYGADFDSDESEGEDGVMVQAHRHQQNTCKHSDAKALSTPAEPRRRHIRKTKRSAIKVHESKGARYESDGEQESMPFQPFACTAAVGLLRLAKENEMF